MRIPFTRENAAEMARRANAAIAARKAETARRLAELDVNATEDARITRTKKQLARLDDLIDKALDKGDDELFLRLATAKDRMWNLVTPKAGVLRPRPGSRRPAPPTDAVPREPRQIWREPDKSGTPVEPAVPVSAAPLPDTVAASPAEPLPRTPTPKIHQPAWNPSSGSHWMVNPQSVQGR